MGETAPLPPPAEAADAPPAPARPPPELPAPRQEVEEAAETAAPAPRGSVSGVARRYRSGDPVPDVLLAVLADRQGAPEIARARADRSGAFRFDGLPTGRRYRVRAAEPDYLTIYELRSAILLHPARLDDRIEVLLTPSASIAGTVVAVRDDGCGGSVERPLAGLEVSLSRRFGRERQQTDEEGRFRFAGLPSGEYTIRTVMPDGLPRVPPTHPVLTREVTLGYGEEARIGFELPEEVAAFTGRVVDAEGRPFAGARVTALPSGSPERDRVDPQRYLTSVSTTTDGRGRYRFERLMPLSQEATTRFLREGAWSGVDYEVIVEAAGRPKVRIIAPPLLRGRVERAPGEPCALHFSGEALELPEIRLAEGGAVSGRVIDANGAPLAAARVSLVPASQKERLPLVPAISVPSGRFSGADGAFLIEDVPPGEYAVSVNGGSPRTEHPMVEVVPGQEVTGVVLRVESEDR